MCVCVCVLNCLLHANSRICYAAVRYSVYSIAPFCTGNICTNIYEGHVVKRVWEYLLCEVC